MAELEKVIKGLECCTFILGKRKCNECPYQKGLPDNGCYQLQDDFHSLLKEQDELLKHEYWRGYNNGRADERGLQEGTIMQTFSPD